MRFDILTLFPEAFDSYFSSSILKRAIQKKKIRVYLHHIRKYTTDKHHTTDDRPYGGGPGMVLKIEPIYRCLQKIKMRYSKSQRRILLFSPRGKEMTQATFHRLKKYKQIIMICGHYEGIDERILKFVDEEISIGKYVVTGGEIPAMIVVDGMSRLVPGVLGGELKTDEEINIKGGIYAYPQYTRPPIFKGLKVPPVLFTGNHKNIRAWREKHTISIKPKK